jgi:hypothetical protein
MAAKPRNSAPMAGGKKDDPNYSQVSGHVPKELALKFRIACTAKEITISDGLERALQIWLEEESKAEKK